MSNFGLFLPEYFKYQSYDNFYDVPIEVQDNRYFVELDYFRTLYRENKNVFYQISKELVFRGGEFSLEKESPLFPKVEFIHSDLIILDSVMKDDAFKKIDYDVFGIQQFIRMFNIENNHFFDHVPIEGFKVLNLSNISISYLKKRFEESGFNIIQYNAGSRDKTEENTVEPTSHIFTSPLDKRFHKDAEESNRSYIIDRSKQVPAPVVPKEVLNDSTPESDVLSDEEKQNVLVKIGQSNHRRLTAFFNAIEENPFFEHVWIKELNLNKHIVRKFDKAGITRLSQLNNENMFIILNKLDQLNTKIIIKELDTCILNHRLIAEKVVSFLSDNSSYNDYSINILLKDNSYNLFKNNAYTLGIRKLGDFTVDNCTALLKSKGVGKTKIYNFVNDLYTIVPSYTYTEQVKKETELPELYPPEPVYFTYGFIASQKIKDYIRENNLSFLKKSEIVQILNSEIKQTKERKRIISDFEEKLVAFERSEITSFRLDDSYCLTILDFFDSLDINYQLDSWDDTDCLNVPLFELSQNDELTEEIKQIIFLYKRSLSTFADIVSSPEETLELNEREKTIFQDRTISDNQSTLEQLASKIGNLSRERVRQIENKMLKKISRILNDSLVTVYLDHLNKNNTLSFDGDSILKKIFMSLENDAFYYNAFFDIVVYYKNKEVIEQIEARMYDLTDNKEIFPKNELLNYLKELIKDNKTEYYIDLLTADLNSYLNKLGYITKKGYVIKERISKSKLYTFVVKTYYSKEILDLSEQSSLNQFLDRLEVISPDNMVADLRSRDQSDMIRSVEAILDRNNNTILKLDSHQYRVLNVNTIPYELIDQIYLFILDQLQSNGFVTTRKIYRTFESLISDSGYTEKTVYNLLKLLYDDEFYFTGKTTLRIYEKGSNLKTTYDIILSFLEKYDGEMTTEQLAEEMGVEEYTLYQHVSDEFSISKGTVYLNRQQNQLQEDTIQAIKEVFNTIMDKKGYVPVKQVLDELRFSGIANNDIVENNLHSADRFTRILKQIFPEIQGHTRLLFKEGQEQNILTIFLSEMTNSQKLYRDDFYDVGSRLGFADVTIALFIKNFIDEGKIVPLNTDLFAPSESFSLSTQVVESVEDFLMENFEDKDYLSLSSINYELYKLPRLENHTWTIELLNYIALHMLNYSKVYINDLSYNADPLIIMYSGSDITYRDIIRSEMSGFNQIRSEQNVLSFLIEKGLLRKNARSLYKWFFTKKILMKNDFERVYLYEDALQYE